jgi:hypothetical protein
VFNSNEYFKGEFRIEFRHNPGQDGHRMVTISHPVMDTIGRVIYLFDIHGKLYNFDHVISMYKLQDKEPYDG